MFRQPNFQHYATLARVLPPLPAAFVYPCDRQTMQFAQTAAFAGFVDPVLIGPAAGIRDAAQAAGIDVLRFPIVETPPGDSRAAARRAVDLGREGRVRALVRGALGYDEMLPPVADLQFGLRTERRLSHVCVLELPGRAEPLFVTDTCLNINPNLAAKKDILENAAELARTLGVQPVDVAVVAVADGVLPAFPSTADAAALRSMAAQGLLPDIRVHGPVTLDRALGFGADGTLPDLVEGGGRPEVLLMPGMEAGSLVLQALLATTHPFVTGLVLGAGLPIIAPGRNDSLESRLAACVLATLQAAAYPGRLRRAA